MLKSTLLMLSVFLALASSGQQRSISGSIKDIQNNSLQGAVVKLMNTLDSSSKTATANEDGKFRFQQLANGSYKLTITHAGLKKYESAVLTIDETHPQINLPVIFMQSGKQQDLKEVTVTAKKKLLEYELDKTIVNVEAMLSAASSNILEVLEKTPGVTVESGGSITLNGKSGVLVLIDGRSTYMSGQDLASYLKSLPGSMVDKIELIENPSSRYEANGGAVINIRLKKNRSLGLTGTISTGFTKGEKIRTNHSLNLNYNRKKLNIFTNIGVNTDGTLTTDFNDRNYYATNGDLYSHVLLNNESYYRNHSISGRLGIDYNLSSKTIIGLQASLNTRPGSGTQYFESNSYNGNNTLDSSNTGDNRTESDWNSQSLNLNFQHRFDEKGKELSGDVNYIVYESDGTRQFYNYLSGHLSNSFSYQLPSRITIYNFKTDYTHPLKGKVMLETGIKLSLVKNDNNSGYYDKDKSQVYSQSNHFLFDENINAAYLAMRKNWKKIGVQGGLRFEDTHIMGDLVENPAYAGTSFRRNFMGLFFSGAISYKIDSLGNHNLFLRHQRRISRPNYQNFNPFLVFRDNYSYSQGNIDLQPGYFNDMALQYRYKQWLTVGIMYGRANGIMFPSTKLIDGKYISSTANLGKGRLLAFNSNLNFKVKKWWQININSQLASMKLWSEFAADNINVSSILFRSTLYSQLTFSKTWSGDLFFQYSMPELQPQRKTVVKYRLNGSLQKKIWKDKGSVRLVFEDALRSWIQRDRTLNLIRSDEYHSGYSDTQRIGLSFSYRFGNEKFARKRKHNDNAADSEKERIQ